VFVRRDSESNVSLSFRVSTMDDCKDFVYNFGCLKRTISLIKNVLPGNFFALRKCD